MKLHTSLSLKRIDNVLVSGLDTQTCCPLPKGQGIGCCPYRVNIGYINLLTLALQAYIYSIFTFYGLICDNNFIQSWLQGDCEQYKSRVREVELTHREEVSNSCLFSNEKKYCDIKYSYKYSNSAQICQNLNLDPLKTIPGPKQRNYLFQEAVCCKDKLHCCPHGKGSNQSIFNIFAKFDYFAHAFYIQMIYIFLSPSDLPVRSKLFSSADMCGLHPPP